MLTRPRGRARRLGLLLLAAAPLLALLALAVPPRQANSDAFIDPAFTALWTRTDGPVAGRAVTRTWVWGPAPGPAKREPYAQGTGGQRVVQYFDKGRMEINHPEAGPSTPFYVTSGLLSVELIGGQVQTGDNQFETRVPANIPLAGDADDTTAPTYAAFAAVSSLPGAAHPAASAVGQLANQSIDRVGSVAPLAAGGNTGGVTYAYYEPQTQHNVAGVFWTFLNSTGPVQTGDALQKAALFQPWFAISGLPISEAYWATAKIAGQPTAVLVQAFQRRVLTYVPSAPAGWQVEMGNIGQHYLEWRYAVGMPPTPAPAPPSGPPAPPAIAITGIVTGKSGLDLNEQTVSLANMGAVPVDMSNWRLVSPKNDHLDVYAFPAGFVLAAGAKVTVFAGLGFDTPDRLYMRRVTWLFDATGFDGVLLYDSLGREVARYVLQGGLAPTPSGGPPTATPPPSPTETVPPAAAPTDTPSGAVTDTPEPQTTQSPAPTDTPAAGATATATLPVPPPTSGP